MTVESWLSRVDVVTGCEHIHGLPLPAPVLARKGLLRIVDIGSVVMGQLWQ